MCWNLSFGIYRERVGANLFIDRLFITHAIGSFFKMMTRMIRHDKNVTFHSM
jgi:hypothetical protein